MTIILTLSEREYELCPIAKIYDEPLHFECAVSNWLSFFL
jgi:hypothetical protein